MVGDISPITSGVAAIPPGNAPFTFTDVLAAHIIKTRVRTECFIAVSIADLVEALESCRLAETIRLSFRDADPVFLGKFGGVFWRIHCRQTHGFIGRCQLLQNHPHIAQMQPSAAFWA